jgi:hypothetical protein
LGGVIGLHDNRVNFGNILESSLILKVGTKLQYPTKPNIPLSIHTIATNGTLQSDEAPKHGILELGTGNAAVKALDYLSSENGVAKLSYAYKEMAYDSGADNPASFTQITGATSVSLSVGELVFMSSTVHGSRGWLVVSTITSLTPNNQMLEYPEGLYRNGVKLMKLWDGNGFGDNNQFEIANNQATQTDDNGNTIKYGTASFDTQYFVVEE